MLYLGIVEQLSSDDKEVKTLMNALKNNLYDLVNIKQKEQLIHIDGVVISMEKQEQLPHVVDWIIACRINPAIFIWVFSKVPLETEKRILLSIGATDVITTPDTHNYLSMSVENTFIRIENKCLESQKKKITSSKVIELSEQNQSILINRSEVDLTRKEFKMMTLLYEQINSTVSYKEISRVVWPNKELNISQIANTICHIRNKINFGDEYSIATVRSKGYMLKKSGGGLVK